MEFQQKWNAFHTASISRGEFWQTMTHELVNHAGDISDYNNGYRHGSIVNLERNSIKWDHIQQVLSLSIKFILSDCAQFVTWQRCWMGPRSVGKGLCESTPQIWKQYANEACENGTQEDSHLTWAGSCSDAKVINCCVSAHIRSSNASEDDLGKTQWRISWMCIACLHE